jgi:hypothetical protein
MSEFIKKFKVLKNLNKEFLNKIKLLYVCEVVWKSLNFNQILIFSNDDKVYGFVSLGLIDVIRVGNFKISEYLCNKQFIDFKYSRYMGIRRTIHGKVYFWGDNQCECGRAEKSVLLLYFNVK